MNNDLISREALKKAIIEGFNLNDVHNQYWWNRVKAIIDNAPTVEYTFEEAFQKTVCEKRLYCPARPHGKWIFRNGGYYKCDKCGEVERAEKNYCPNCGAKMGGGRQ